jgi:Domain of unknown function (DUF4261)
MPTKGFFSQGLVVLLSKPVALEEIEELIDGHGELSRKPASESWEISGPTILVPYRPEVNGYVSLDLVDRAWPDEMGHPQETPILFGSWSMGHFGPCTFPGNLARALQQSWHWPVAKQVVPEHRAFIRVRSSYIFGAKPNRTCLPQDYAPHPELLFLTGIIRNLMGHPHILAYFNPGGEVLMGMKEFNDAVEFSKTHSLPPLNVWSNVRLFNFDENWLVMDTIGMEQLDLPDHEACFPKTTYQPRQVAGMLRDVSLYLLKSGEVIKDGHTMDGPGNCRWQAKSFADGLSPAPRRVLRWFPCDGSKPPPQMLAAAQEANPAA